MEKFIAKNTLDNALKNKEQLHKKIVDLQLKNGDSILNVPLGEWEKIPRL